MDKTNIIFGLRPVIETIDAGKDIDKIFVKKGLKGELFSLLLDKAKKANIPVSFVPVEKLNKFRHKNHQGVMAFVSPINFYNIEDIIPLIYEKGKTPFVLILDRVSDVRNFGSIVRTAECAGVDAIVIPFKGAAQINADAVKTSAGALHKMPVCRSSNLSKTVDFLKNSGLTIFAATEKAAEYHFDADFKKPLAVIMGAEGDGISSDLLKKADFLIKIPILGKIEALNVSNACSIIVYEVIRQRLS